MSATIPPEITDFKRFPMKSSRIRRDTPEYWEAIIEEYKARSAGKYKYGERAYLSRLRQYQKEVDLRRDPQIRQVYDGLIKAGWPTGDLIEPRGLKKALDAGISPELLVRHYVSALKSYSVTRTIDHAAMYGFKMAGHGVNFMVTDSVIDDLKAGKYIGVANWRKGDELWDPKTNTYIGPTE